MLRGTESSAPSEDAGLQVGYGEAESSLDNTPEDSGASDLERVRRRGELREAITRSGARQVSRLSCAPS
jgi:hypothetical protein